MKTSGVLEIKEEELRNYIQSFEFRGLLKSIINTIELIRDEYN